MDIPSTDYIVFHEQTTIPKANQWYFMNTYNTTPKRLYAYATGLSPYGNVIGEFAINTFNVPKSNIEVLTYSNNSIRELYIDILKSLNLYMTISANNSLGYEIVPIEIDKAESNEYNTTGILFTIKNFDKIKDKATALFVDDISKFTINPETGKRYNTNGYNYAPYILIGYQPTFINYFDVSETSHDIDSLYDNWFNPNTANTTFANNIAQLPNFTPNFINDTIKSSEGIGLRLWRLEQYNVEPFYCFQLGCGAFNIGNTAYKKYEFCPLVYSMESVSFSFNGFYGRNSSNESYKLCNGMSRNVFALSQRRVNGSGHDLPRYILKLKQPIVMQGNITFNFDSLPDTPPKPPKQSCRTVFTTTNAEHAKVNGRIYTANAKKSLINPYDENAKTGGGCGSYGD